MKKQDIFTIRKAKKSDIATLIQLDLELVDYHKKIDALNKSGRQARAYITKLYKRNLSKRDVIYFIVENEQHAIGFLYCIIKPGSPFSTIKRAGYIEAAYVKAKFRKKTIGRLMFDAASVWFKSKKIKYVFGSVNGENDLALNFWRKMGASVQGYYLKAELI